MFVLLMNKQNSSIQFVFSLECPVKFICRIEKQIQQEINIFKFVGIEKITLLLCYLNGPE